MPPLEARTALTYTGARLSVGGLKVHLAMGIDSLLDETYAEHLSKAGAMVAGYVQSQRINEAGRTLWLKFDLNP